MEEINLSPDEKRSVLKDFNHRINNDLQVLLAFIKLQKRLGVDNDEIINSSCVCIASVSLIQNMMFESDDNEHLINTGESFEKFTHILDEYYTQFNIRFTNEIKTDLKMKAKKVFHIMFLLNEMINLSIKYSFKEEAEKVITFNLEKSNDECLLTYTDNGSGIKETISESDMKTMLFEQLVKQIDGNVESGNDSKICIKFSYE